MLRIVEMQKIHCANISTLTVRNTHSSVWGKVNINQVSLKFAHLHRMLYMYIIPKIHVH